MRYRSRRSIRHDLRAGKPSARHDVTTSSRPSAYVGKEGRQPKSRRKRAFDVEKEELKRRGPHRPRKNPASPPGMRRGGGGTTPRGPSPPEPGPGDSPPAPGGPTPGLRALPRAGEPAAGAGRV